MKHIKQFGTNALLTLISILSLLVVFECGLRIYQKVSLEIPLLYSDPTLAYLDGQAAARMSSTADEKLGWKPVPNFRFDGVERNADGSSHPLSVTQDSNGFRSYGDPETDRTKIFVLGDSYTQAVEVSNDKTYYSLLGEKLGAEIFGVGARGFSSLQEYMLLDKHIDQIKPNAIVWQFCYNDFMGNYFPLDRKWLPGGLGLRRPYLENGEVHYHIAKPFGWLLGLNNGLFRTIPMALIRIDRLNYSVLNNNQDSLLNDILKNGRANPDFSAAISTTDKIFDLVKSRVQSIPVVMFEICTTAPPLHSAVSELAKNHQFHFVDELPALLDIERAAGRTVDSFDKVHLNEAGHRIVADSLSRKWSINFMMPALAPQAAR